MSPQELLAEADEHDSDALWYRAQATALREQAARKLSAEAGQAETAGRTPPRQGRNSKTRRPSVGRTASASPRLRAGVTREQLPKFGLPRQKDPTGQQELILGVLWITKGSSWSPRELEDELSRTGLAAMKRNMATTFLRRMAVAEPPLVVKLGEGRGTRYELAPDIHPIEQANNLPST